MTHRFALLMGFTLQAALLAQPTNEAPTDLVERLRTVIAVPAKDTPKDSGKETNLDHILVEGDVMQLQVYQEEDLNLPRATITKDGTVSHPLLGLIKIGGKTLEQAQQTIFELLKADYLVDPRVILTIVQYAKFRFTVVGQVNRPGTYESPSNETLTMVQAVALAGGPTRLGSLSKIKVQRVVEGVKKEIKLDLNKKEDKTLPVLDDDVIEVGERIL